MEWCIGGAVKGAIIGDTITGGAFGVGVNGSAVIGGAVSNVLPFI